MTYGIQSISVGFAVARVTEELGIGKLGNFVRKETDSLQFIVGERRMIGRLNAG
jgi:hypothetical protein